jgi:hypothetical protein
MDPASRAERSQRAEASLAQTGEGHNVRAQVHSGVYEVVMGLPMCVIVLGTSGPSSSVADVLDEPS